MDEKKPLPPPESLESRKRARPPQFSKENIIEGLRAQQQHLKQHAPSVPTVFPVDEPEE